MLELYSVARVNKGTRDLRVLWTLEEMPPDTLTDESGDARSSPWQP